MTENVYVFIADALTALGASEDTIEGVFQMTPNSWMLSFTDDTQMDISLDEDGLRLNFFAEIGPVNPDKRAAQLEAMLTFNMLSGDTGGVRIGLAAPTGNATMISDIHATAISTGAITANVLGLRTMAARWRDIMQNGPTQDDFAHDNMIRV